MPTGSEDIRELRLVNRGAQAVNPARATHSAHDSSRTV